MHNRGKLIDNNVLKKYTKQAHKTKVIVQHTGRLDDAATEFKERKSGFKAKK